MADVENMVQLLLLVSSLTIVNVGGVLRSSFNGLHKTGLGTVWGSSDKSSDSMEPAIDIKRKNKHKKLK